MTITFDRGARNGTGTTLRTTNGTSSMIQINVQPDAAAGFISDLLGQPDDHHLQLRQRAAVGRTDGGHPGGNAVAAEVHRLHRQEQHVTCTSAGNVSGPTAGNVANVAGLAAGNDVACQPADFARETEGQHLAPGSPLARYEAQSR